MTIRSQFVERKEQSTIPVASNRMITDRLWDDRLQDRTLCSSQPRTSWRGGALQKFEGIRLIAMGNYRVVHGRSSPDLDDSKGT